MSSYARTAWSAAFALAVLSAPSSGAAQNVAQERADALRCVGLRERMLTLPAGHPEESVRLAEATGLIASRSIGLRRPSDPMRGARCPIADAEPLWQSVVAGVPLRIESTPARMLTQFNGAAPDDRNNGPVWAGRGLSSSISGGVLVASGPVTAAWIPIVAWQQNRPFPLRAVARAGFSPLINGYYPGRIDLPQRHGSSSFSVVDAAGQSFVRVDAYGVSLGLSHENALVGPAARNPILLSATAPGFTHLFFEVAELDLRVAHLNATVLAGYLEESEYFDSIASNDRSGLALWTLSIRPRGLAGLEIGVARTYMTAMPSDGGVVDERGLAEVLALGSASNLSGNELASLYARWVMPEAGAEIYGEWARDDRFSGVKTDLIPEIDHSQAYGIGLTKVTPAGGGHVRVAAELNHLQEKAENRGGRPLPVYYTHHSVRQGYTNRGQLLGASIGPGADAQYVGVDWLDDWGHAGFFVERVRRNDASAAAIEARRGWPYRHDTTMTAGIRGAVRWRGIDFAAVAAYDHRYYRDFLMEEDRGLRLELDVLLSPRR